MHPGRSPALQRRPRPAPDHERLGWLRAHGGDGVARPGLDGHPRVHRRYAGRTERLRRERAGAAGHRTHCPLPRRTRRHGLRHRRARVPAHAIGHPLRQRRSAGRSAVARRAPRRLGCRRLRVVRGLWRRPGHAARGLWPRDLRLALATRGVTPGPVSTPGTWLQHQPRGAGAGPAPAGRDQSARSLGRNDAVAHRWGRRPSGCLDAPVVAAGRGPPPHCGHRPVAGGHRAARPRVWLPYRAGRIVGARRAHARRPGDRPVVGAALGHRRLAHPSGGQARIQRVVVGRRGDGTGLVAGPGGGDPAAVANTVHVLAGSRGGCAPSPATCRRSACRRSGPVARRCPCSSRSRSRCRCRRV